MSNRRIVKKAPPAVRRKTNKPRCPVHEEEMSWALDRGMFVCTHQDGCTKVAYAKADDLTSTNPVVPRVVRDNMELLVITDPDNPHRPRVQLRLRTHGTLVDITDHVQTVLREGGSSGVKVEMHFGSAMYLQP